MPAQDGGKGTMVDEQIEPAERGGPAKVDPPVAGPEQEIGEVAINSHTVLAFFSSTF
jgi:hypothetical protein